MPRRWSAACLTHGKETGPFSPRQMDQSEICVIGFPWLPSSPSITKEWPMCSLAHGRSICILHLRRPFCFGCSACHSSSVPEPESWGEHGKGKGRKAIREIRRWQLCVLGLMTAAGRLPGAAKAGGVRSTPETTPVTYPLTATPTPIPPDIFLIGGVRKLQTLKRHCSSTEQWLQ